MTTPLKKDQTEERHESTHSSSGPEGDFKVVFPSKPRQANHNNKVTLFTNMYKLIVAPINKNQTIEKYSI